MDAVPQDSQGAGRSGGPPPLDERVAISGQSAHQSYLKVARAIGLILDTDVITIACASGDKSYIKRFCLDITHTNVNIRTEELTMLCRKSVDGIFTVDMREHPDKAHLGIPYERIQPTIGKLLDKMEQKVEMLSDILLKDDIAEFVRKQRNKGAESVITEADCSALEELLSLKDGSGEEAMEIESENEGGEQV